MPQLSENKPEEKKVTDTVNENTGNEKAVSLSTGTDAETAGKPGKKERKKKEKKPMDKAKKKKIRRRIAAVVIVALIATFFVRNSLMAKNTLPTVFTTEATVQDVEQTLRTSGTVKVQRRRLTFQM